eukprot:scaffold92751_cov28-Tisochrysis_lutea.AAC.1
MELRMWRALKLKERDAERERVVRLTEEEQLGLCLLPRLGRRGVHESGAGGLNGLDARGRHRRVAPLPFHLPSLSLLFALALRAAQHYAPRKRS